MIVIGFLCDEAQIKHLLDRRSILGAVF